MEKGSLLRDPFRSDAVGFEEQRPLCSGFIRSAQRFPQRPAVVAEGKVLSYEELHELACRIAATIQKYPEFSPTSLTVVFAYRSTTAFAGVLGALLAGNGYVPLNRTFPEGRTQVMFERSESRSLVVDAKSLPQLNEKQRSNLIRWPICFLPPVVRARRKGWPLLSAMFFPFLTTWSSAMK